MGAISIRCKRCGVLIPNPQKHSLRHKRTCGEACDKALWAEAHPNGPEMPDGIFDVLIIGHPESRQEDLVY